MTLPQSPAATGMRSLKRGVAAASSAILLATSAPAAEHIVPRTELHAAVAQNQRASHENRQELLRLLGAPQSREALASAGFEFKQVQQAVSALDDETAALLAERARQANRDFAAGALSNQTLTYIVIALGAAVIVLIAVS